MGAFFCAHFQKEEIHMELSEEEKRQLFQVDGDCQAKVMDELYIPFF